MTGTLMPMRTDKTVLRTPGYESSTEVKSSQKKPLVICLFSDLYLALHYYSKDPSAKVGRAVMYSSEGIERELISVSQKSTQPATVSLC